MKTKKNKNFQMQCNGIFIEGEIDDISFKKLVENGKCKTYVKPNRECDFKHGGMEVFTNEGMAFLNNGIVFDVVFDKKRNAVGFKEIKSFRTKKNAIYETKIVEKYKKSISDNILLSNL